MTSDPRLYYFHQKGIYPSIKRYIPSDQKVYTFLLRGIYLSLCTYIGEGRRPSKKQSFLLLRRAARHAEGDLVAHE